MPKFPGHKWFVLSPNSVLPGTYIYIAPFLRRVCRLYHDTQKAFLTPLHPRGRLQAPSAAQLGSSATSKEEPFQRLSLTSTDDNMLSVAVPSRLSARRALRIAVKDVYRLKGLKTSLCNAAYHRLSSPAIKSAAIVQSLVDHGHHIIGLTNLSCMIGRDEYLNVVDFPTPRNPRGDGYLAPAGSSSGSAVAVASYPWVDCALGTDSSGCGRVSGPLLILFCGH